MSRCLADVGTDDFEKSFEDELNEFASEFNDAVMSVGELWTKDEIEISVDSWERDGKIIKAEVSLYFEVGHETGCSDISLSSTGEGRATVELNVRTGKVEADVIEAYDRGD